MAFGLFDALFSVSGNASEEFQQIRTSIRDLTGETNSLIPAMRTLGRTLLSNATATDLQNASIQKAITRVFTLANSGQVTGQSLQNLAKQLLAVADLASPVLSSRLRQVSENMMTLAASARQAELEARQAAGRSGGFLMMRDVSDNIKTNFQQLSAASQGLMISMSLLQRNATGLAFSLIFLQFSGFLKLSLGVAAVATGLGFAYNKVKDFISEGKKVRELNTIIETIALSEVGLKVATEDLEQVSEKWGVSMQDLLRYFATSLSAGISTTADDMELFAQTLIMLDKNLIFGIDDVDSLIMKMIKLRRASDSTEEVIRGLGFTTRNFREELQYVLQQRLDELVEGVDLGTIKDNWTDFFNPLKWFEEGMSATEWQAEIERLGGLIRELEAPTVDFKATITPEGGETASVTLKDWANKLGVDLGEIDISPDFTISKGLSGITKEYNGFWKELFSQNADLIEKPIGEVWEQMPLDQREKAIKPMQENWSTMWLEMSINAQAEMIIISKAFLGFSSRVLGMSNEIIYAMATMWDSIVAQSRSAWDAIGDGANLNFKRIELYAAESFRNVVDSYNAMLSATGGGLVSTLPLEARVVAARAHLGIARQLASQQYNFNITISNNSFQTTGTPNDIARIASGEIMKSIRRVTDIQGAPLLP